MPKEIKVPAIIVLAGYVLFVGVSFQGMTDSAYVARMFTFTLLLAVQVAIGIVACYLFSILFGTGLGVLKYAVVKLAAVTIVASLVMVLLPGYFFINLIVALTVSAVLLENFFDIEYAEGFFLALLIVILNFVVALMLASWLRA